ncbi:hypothetical protein ACIBRY_09310 [Streptomyces anulatus]
MRRAQQAGLLRPPPPDARDACGVPVGASDETHRVFRTFWSRTAADNEWWNTYPAAENTRSADPAAEVSASGHRRPTAATQRLGHDSPESGGSPPPTPGGCTSASGDHRSESQLISP